MQWASAAADDAEIEPAVERAASALRAQLGACPADLVVAFVSPHHADAYARLPELLASRLGTATLIGCSAGGVIGGGREIEQRPGLALSAAYLPGVTVQPLRLGRTALPAADADPAVWREHLGVAEDEPQLVLLPDPFSFDAEAIIRGLDRAYPGGTTIGGVASGGRQPGENALLLGAELHRDGMVGVALSGNLAIDTVVAQGCRPIGEPMFVTGCERNIIRQLDGKPPLAILQDLHERLDARDRQLARHSLFLGIVMKEDRVEYRQGDFLIRNLLGIDPQSGALAIGALIDETSVVQFHLRDAATSALDLEAMLQRYRQRQLPAPRGA